MKKSAILICLLMGLCGSFAHAGGPVLLSETGRSVSLGPALEYLEDPSASLALEDVLSPPLSGKFQAVAGRIPNFGITSSAFWFRVVLLNQEPDILEWILMYEVPIMKRIDLYYGPPGGPVSHKRGGTELSFHEREMPHPSHLFRMHLPPGEPIQVLIRFETDSGMLVNLAIAPPDVFADQDRKNIWILGINVGVLCAIALINLILFLTIRGKIYLYFYLFLLSFGLYFGSLSGFTAQYFWPSVSYLPHLAPLVFGALLQFFGILFSTHYMEVPTRHPQSYRGFLALMILSLAGLVLAFVHYRAANILLSVLGLGLFIILGLFSLWSWRKGNPLARQYILFWSFYFIGGFLFMLTISGFLEPNFYLLHAWPFGFSIGGILLSLALGERFNRLERAYRIELEEKIEERTFSLNKSLQATNMEIESRRKAEQMLSRERLAFRMIAEAAVHAERTEDLCRRILSGLIETLGFDTGSVRLFDPETNLLSPVATIGMEGAGNAAGQPQSLDNPEDPSSLAGRSRKTIFAPEAENHPIWNYYKKWLRESGAKALIAAPIIGSGGNLFAVLMLTAQEPKSLAQDDRVFFDTVAGMFSVVLERLWEKERLAESEERYRLLADNISDVIWTMDLNFRLTYQSPSIEKLTGYTVQESMALSLEQKFTPDSLKNVLRAISEEIQREQSGRGDPGRGRAFELEVYRKDGSTVWTETRVTSLRDAEGNPLLLFGVTRNIDQRKRTEEALYESQRLYRLVTENVSDVIWTLNLNMTTTFATPSVERLIGYTPEELKDLYLVDVLTPASLETAIEVIQREMALEESGQRDPNQTLSLELEQIRKDGSTVWTEVIINPLRDPDGNLTGLLGLTRDISKRKLAEDQLRKAHDKLEQRVRERTVDLFTSEERYRALVETAPDIIYTLSAENQTITSLNPAFEKQTGWKSADFIGKSFEEILHPEDLKLARKTTLQVLRGEIPDPYVLRIRNADGRYLWSEFLSRPKMEGGRVVGEFGIVRNITKRIQVEEEREKLEKQLRQSQKMEAIGRLAGGVAHDFNNILTAILGYADVIFANLKPENPIYADVEEIKNSSLRAAALIQQLLAFSRKQIISPKPINLNEILDRSKKMLGRIIGEDIELIVISPADLWNILADASQMEQVLINLAVNARDAMPHGGKLIIRCKNLTWEEMLPLTGEIEKPGPHVLLSVTDNGHGMNEEVKRHIFEPFFSTKEKDKGTGLGLATVYGVVSQNHGFLKVFSEPQLGTTFNIYFPQVKELVEKTDPAGDGVYPHGAERILLVEDEDMVRGLARRILESFGYQVHEATDGLGALAFCNRFPGTIDLLLTDVVMPKMDGKELYEKLKETRPGIKVLFMSGYAEHTIAYHGVLLTEMPFMHKPFKVKDLTFKVREALDGVAMAPDE